MRIAGLATVTMALFGCAAVAGLDDYGPAGEVSSPEVCDNGKDDDRDGQVDCRDDDCVDRACVAAVPSDFEGPIVLVAGEQPPSCAQGTQVLLGGTTVVAEATSCDACCTVDGGCEATLAFAMQQICDESPELMTVSPGCTNLAALSEDYAYLGLTGVDVGTSCGTASDPPGLFDEWIGGCRIDGGAGCGPTQTCVPKDTAAGICVYRNGDVGCPATGYTAKTLLQSVVSDDRSCAPCDCSVSGTPLCAGAFDLYEGADCDGSPTNLGIPTSCTSFVPPIQSADYQPSSIGECTASGTMGGSADIEAVTICCLP